MKKPYTKPILTRQHAGITNKFAPFSAVRYKDAIDGVEIGTLVERYGSPLFVYSLKTIKESFRRARKAFELRYPRVQFAWSYKTNYLQAVCRAFHSLGSWAEVVSEAEYEMARRLGMPGDKIIFNGPHKSREALRRAAREGALINIDSYDEIPELEGIADELGGTLDVGVRINMAIPGHAAWDRFGLNVESGEAYHTLKRALAGGRLDIVGLHTHIGTFVMEPRFYTDAVTRMIDLGASLKREFGTRLRYFDVGGGFASRTRLKGSYIPTTQLVPDMDGYAEAICSPLLDRMEKEELPLLILETGRALIDEAGALVATVVSTRRLPSGIRALVLDAGVNLLFTAFWYDLEILPTTDKGLFSELHNVYGPMCMQIDVVGENVRIPCLEKGETVLIRPVGAYNNTQWLQFIELRPNVVMIGERGEVAVVRERETADHLLRLDRVPEWLKDPGA